MRKIWDEDKGHWEACRRKVSARVQVQSPTQFLLGPHLTGSGALLHWGGAVSTLTLSSPDPGKKMPCFWFWGRGTRKTCVPRKRRRNASHYPRHRQSSLPLGSREKQKLSASAGRAGSHLKARMLHWPEEALQVKSATDPRLSLFFVDGRYRKSSKLRDREPA